MEISSRSIQFPEVTNRLNLSLRKKGEFNLKFQKLTPAFSAFQVLTKIPHSDFMVH